MAAVSRQLREEVLLIVYGENEVVRGVLPQRLSGWPLQEPVWKAVTEYFNSVQLHHEVPSHAIILKNVPDNNRRTYGGGSFRGGSLRLSRNERKMLRVEGDGSLGSPDPQDYARCDCAMVKQVEAINETSAKLNGNNPIVTMVKWVEDEYVSVV